MIRPAAQGDSSAMGKIYCLSWQGGYKDILPEEYLAALTEEVCAPKKVNPDCNLVWEEADGTLAGLVNFGAARGGEENIGELRAIYVLPEVWGSGIAAKLFSAAAERLKARGFEHFYLWVLEDNLRARRFYEKMGMRRADERKEVNIGGKFAAEVKYVI